jgi:predicted peptidase
VRYSLEVSVRWGVILWSLLALSSSTHGEVPTANASLFEKRIFEQGELKANYRLLKPSVVESGKTYPLVLFLHGAGERGSDNDKPLVHGVKIFSTPDFLKRYPCFVVVPQCPDGQMWANIPWDSPAPKMPAEPTPIHRAVSALLDSLEKEFPIDRQREYVTGLSMGGFGTFDMILRHPKRFAAAAPVCGGVDLEKVVSVKELPIWIFHGDKDGVVKADRSREAFATLQQAGGAPKYTEYPGVGHNSWNNAYADPALYEWMFAQKRPTP